MQPYNLTTGIQSICKILQQLSN